MALLTHEKIDNYWQVLKVTSENGSSPLTIISDASEAIKCAAEEDFFKFTKT